MVLYKTAKPSLHNFGISVKTMDQKNKSIKRPMDDDDYTTAMAPKKSLKFAQPDLSIVVGKEQCLFQYYAVIMARHSNYIENMVASHAKESGHTLTIYFTDIPRDDWLHMIAYLENAFGAAKLSPEDAMRLIHFYDKYEFPVGKAICSRVIKDHVEEGGGEMDQYINIYLLAEQFQLEQIKDSCVALFEKKLSVYDTARHLTQKELKLLAPIIVKHSCLMACAYTEDNDEVLSLCWPKFFLSQKLLEHATNYGFSRVIDPYNARKIFNF